MNNDEREKLTMLIEEEEGKNWWKPEEFKLYIQALLPSELTVVAPPPEYAENYNCFVFAFGLEREPNFLGGNNPIQQEFVKYLLDRNILKITEMPEHGDLIFYKDSEENITHAGILKLKDAVLSKWMWGPIIENNILDVPSSFGDTVFYTKPLKQNEVKEQYQIYKDSGVEIKPIT